MLQGEHVVLRPIQAWDRERLYELVETIEVRALAHTDPPLPLSLEEIQARDRRWMEERHTDYAWFAIDVDTETIGICGLHEIDHYHQRADVGIRIGKPYWGRGHGQDAVRTLVDYGFSQLNLAKISLQVLADDERAVGAYRKAGFVEEGRLARSHVVRWHAARRARHGRASGGLETLLRPVVNLLSQRSPPASRSDSRTMPGDGDGADERSHPTYADRTTARSHNRTCGC